MVSHLDPLEVWVAGLEEDALAGDEGVPVGGLVSLGGIYFQK